MSDLDLLGRLASVLPQGPGASADTALVTVGRVYEIDASTRRLRVGVRDSALWLPALPGRYKTGRDVRVLMDTTAGRPAVVLGPVDPVSPIVRAVLTASSGTSGTVNWYGTSTPLPSIPSSYTVGQAVYVHTDEWGDPKLIMGPSTVAVETEVPPAPAPATGGGTRQVTVTISPQWSGTWRHIRGAWDRWNLDKYGRAALWQGDAYGSGLLTGLATYGDQFVNLGAVSIDRVRIRISRLEGGGNPQLQGSPHGTAPNAAPTVTGAVVSGDGMVELASDTRSGMRTGAIKAVALVGGVYGAWRGAGQDGGMSAEVTYTRKV